MTLFNGFLIDATGRVVFNDTDAIVGTYVGIPVTSAGDCACSQTGVVVASSNRCGVNAAGRVVYQDVSSVPYAGVVFTNGGMSFTQSGALLCASSGAIMYYNGGLPYTAAGYLAIDGSTPVIPDYIVTEAGDYLLTEGGDYLVTEFPVPVATYVSTSAGQHLVTTSGNSLVTTQ